MREGVMPDDYTGSDPRANTGTPEIPAREPLHPEVIKAAMYLVQLGIERDLGFLPHRLSFTMENAAVGEKASFIFQADPELTPEELVSLKTWIEKHFTGSKPVYRTTERLSLWERLLDEVHDNEEPV